MKFKSLILPVLATLVLATVSQAAFYEWSKTANSNATADPTINWSEGMSPSSVNDSARAMMARAAEYRDDISGALTTGGTSTAYTLTTNQVLPATPTTGQLIAFTPNVTNGVAPTLTTDGGTTFAIQTSPGVAVPAGTLVAGTPYTAKFTGTVWMLRNFYGNPYAVPLGSVVDCTCTTAPNSNFVLAFGQAISRTTYSTFFSMVGTTYGVGDGTTTFNVPDLRGRVIAGLDNMGGVTAGRISVAGGNFDATVLGTVGGQQNRTLTAAQIPANIPNSASTTVSMSPSVTGSTTSTLQQGSGSAFNAPSGSVGPASFTPVTSVTINPSGGDAHPTITPVMILNKILRIF